MTRDGFCYINHANNPFGVNCGYNFPQINQMDTENINYNFFQSSSDWAERI